MCWRSEKDAGEVWEHVEQQRLVRAGILGGDGKGEKGGYSVADRLWVGIHVQQYHVEGPQDH